MKDTSGGDKQQVQPWHHAMEQNKLHLVCHSLRDTYFSISIGAWVHIWGSTAGSVQRGSKILATLSTEIGSMVFVPRTCMVLALILPSKKETDSHFRGDIASILRCFMFSKYLHFSCRTSRWFLWLLLTSVAGTYGGPPSCPCRKCQSFWLPVRASGLGSSKFRMYVRMFFRPCVSKS